MSASQGHANLIDGFAMRVRRTRLMTFLVTGTIDALGSLLLGDITNPVKAILFLVAGAMCSRVAFGRR